MGALKAHAEEKPEWPPLIEGGPKTTTMDRELKEFRMLGPARLAEVEKSLPGLSPEERGYMLGLSVVRVLLKMMPDAVRAGMEI